MSKQAWQKRNERNMRNKVAIPSATDDELLTRAETALENANKASDHFHAAGADLVVASLELAKIVRELRLRTGTTQKPTTKPKPKQRQLDMPF